MTIGPKAAPRVYNHFCGGSPALPPRRWGLLGLPSDGKRTAMSVLQPLRRAAAGLAGLAMTRAPQALTLRALERGIARRQGRDALADLPDGLHVLLAGAGGPLADPQRSGPCIAVQAGRRLFVIDAGANGARNLGRFGVNLGRLEAVFLTHAHSDHIDGLGELGILRWVGGGHERPLPVHGPPVVGAVSAGFNQAYRADFGYRTAHHGEEIAPPGGAGLAAAPFPMPADGERRSVLETDDGVQVSAFAVSHAPVCEAVGYRIDYRGRSVVVSGDTAYSANLVEQARGVDLLVHDALSSRITERIAAAAESNGGWRIAQILRDVPSYHATPIEAAQAASAAGAGQLLLAHIVPPLSTAALERVFLSGVADVYDGRVTLGRDGALISLPV